MSQQQRLGASFRDPNGFMFRRDGILYRQINRSYEQNYHLLMESGLYKSLIEKQLLIPHEVVALDLAVNDDAFQVICPVEIPMISYPYEWSFSQLKDAALTTLRIQQIALQHGMTLKDSSAYNIQFRDGRPLLIDTLSFEPYQEGAVWIPYRQFCQHFLAPLALMNYTDVRLSQLLKVYIDGIPLDLAAKLLPARARFRLSLLLHLFIHSQSQKRYKDKALDQTAKQQKMSRNSLMGLLENLESGIQKLDWQAAGSWMDYYQDDSYVASAFEHKKQLVLAFLDEIRPHKVWDLGANTGVFSRLASQQGIQTVAWDFDPSTVELNYQQIKSQKESHLLPLVLDLTNPSSAIGWNHQERDSFAERAPVDMIFALALIHHLVIANNVPLSMAAAFFAGLGSSLVIEFVPKQDKKVQTLLSSREDIFPDYTESGFERAFEEHFVIQQKALIQDSKRILYLMKTRQA